MRQIEPPVCPEVWNQGETFVAESGAMVCMTTDLDVDTKFNGAGDGGFVGWLKAALAGLARA